ncbi:hypothetical protein H0H81_011393 [Sphagnurus paluster]|uniref:Uncharacterized protein n=1 Tax=Sphagnurus paluster TaxID=117069 RepID=A0A9P7K519_9AGAR|nr:hypothetical protein H0H81_011393 [Sphagnurus paluster]
MYNIQYENNVLAATKYDHYIHSLDNPTTYIAPPGGYKHMAACIACNGAGNPGRFTVWDAEAKKYSHAITRSPPLPYDFFYQDWYDLQYQPLVNAHLMWTNSALNVVRLNELLTAQDVLVWQTTQRAQCYHENQYKAQQPPAHQSHPTYSYLPSVLVAPPPLVPPPLPPPAQATIAAAGGQTKHTRTRRNKNRGSAADGAPISANDEFFVPGDDHDVAMAPPATAATAGPPSAAAAEPSAAAAAA